MVNDFNQESVLGLVFFVWNGSNFGLFEIPSHVWTLGYYYFKVKWNSFDLYKFKLFSLLIDLGKFMTVLFLFLIGFSMLVTAMNTPFFPLDLNAEVIKKNIHLYLLKPCLHLGGNN